MPALAEPITSAFRRAKSAMQGNHAVRLEAALGEIKRLEGERARIRERLAAHSLRFTRYAESLDNKSKETGDVADEVAAKLAWMVVKENAKNTPIIRYGMLPPGVTTLDNEATAEFMGKFPEWRTPLAEVARIRVEVATAQLKQVEAEVKKSFAVLNLDEDINDDRRVKRLRRRVDRWENIAGACRGI